MRTKRHILTDLAQMAQGAASSFGMLKDDIDIFKKNRRDRNMAASGHVTQEDFDALATRTAALAARVTALEAAQKPQKPDPKKSAPKTAPPKNKPASATAPKSRSK